ncbi:MAG: NYN domain-containing protein [Alphaproteobacteria bacterium]
MIELNGVAHLGRQFLHRDEIVPGDPVLLAARLDDCVHGASALHFEDVHKRRARNDAHAMSAHPPRTRGSATIAAPPFVSSAERRKRRRSRILIPTLRVSVQGDAGRSEETGEPIFQQKRVDIMLGVDMALLAGKGRISRAAILAGDSDFIPAIEVVKQEGVLTTLWHGPSTPLTRPSRELVEICDERIELTGEFIEKIGRAD